MELEIFPICFCFLFFVLFFSHLGTCGMSVKSFSESLRMTWALSPPPPVLSKPLDCHQHGGARLQANLKFSLPQNAVGHHPIEALSIGLSGYHNLGYYFLLLSNLVAKIGQWLHAHMASLKCFAQHRRLSIILSSSWQGPLVLCGGGPCQTSPIVIGL